jgi:transcriptional regulator with XRE-family HTH domain
MNTRLKQFIAAENITQAQLADNLNVVRASVSHILAGRNKPGYDFICGLMSHYPNLNIEWLMFGKGKMYKTQEQQTIFDTNLQENEEKDEISLLTDFAQPEFTAPEQAPAAQPVPQQQPGVTLNDIKTLVNTIQKPVNQRKLVKITAFFDDGTFQELTAL